jgi:hypothetical protein
LYQTKVFSGSGQPPMLGFARIGNESDNKF